MPVFVVERYLPALTSEEVEALALSERAVAGDGVRHIRSTYVREDELCFSVFEAPSKEALGEANDRAAMAYERIVEAIDVDGALA